MARKLTLRRVNIAAGDGAGPEFDYGEIMRLMLRHPSSAGQGVTLDEVIRCVDAVKPIDEAIAAKAGEVTLSEEQWTTLKDKLNGFSFTLADQVIVEFGLMIRNAPEIGTETVTELKRA